jgi:hyperosmotically inducible periplasmic protein
MKVKTVRRITLISSLVFTLSAIFMLSACATMKTTPSTSSIETSIRDSYSFKTYLQNDNIAINAMDGKVTLDGTVPDASHMIVAEKVAKGVTGVDTVKNNLQVEGGAPVKDTDAWLGAQVKAELMMHPDVNAARTDVYVKKGEVTLGGQADSDAQRTLTAEYAKNVKGVKHVLNTMTVASAAPATPQQTAQGPDDATITANVKSALEADRSTSEINPSIDTKNKIVIVHGVAENQAQKDLVTHIITGVTGVQHVVNEMTVAGVASNQPQATGQGVDDESITARAKTALDANASTTNLDVAVETNNGVVTVAGTADNQAQKELVTRILSDVNGVNGVDNEMTIMEQAVMVK